MGGASSSTNMSAFIKKCTIPIIIAAKAVQLSWSRACIAWNITAIALSSTA